MTYYNDLSGPLLPGGILLLTLKINQSVISQQQEVYLGITNNCNLGHESHGKIIDKPSKQKRGMLFYGEKGGS